MSPAAQMPGAEVSRSAEQAHAAALARARARPTRASITSGIAPVPITTMSAVELAPGGGDGRAPPRGRALEPLEPVAAHQLDPTLAQQRAEERRRSGPKCVDSGASSTITIVQRRPCGRERGRNLAGDVGPADQHHVLGRLAPRRGSRPRAERRAGGGPPPAGRPSTRSRRTFAPVAISATPYSTTSLVDGVAVRAAVSRRITLVRVRQLDRAPGVPGGIVDQARVAVLLAGQIALGRRRALVGRIGLAPPPAARGPPKPPSCRASAHVAAAGPPPTISAPTWRSATRAVGRRRAW